MEIVAVIAAEHLPANQGVKFNCVVCESSDSEKKKEKEKEQEDPMNAPVVQRRHP